MLGAFEFTLTRPKHLLLSEIRNIFNFLTPSLPSTTFYAVCGKKTVGVGDC